MREPQLLDCSLRSVDEKDDGLVAMRTAHPDEPGRALGAAHDEAVGTSVAFDVHSHGISPESVRESRGFCLLVSAIAVPTVILVTWVTTKAAASHVLSDVISTGWIRFWIR